MIMMLETQGKLLRLDAAEYLKTMAFACRIPNPQAFSKSRKPWGETRKKGKFQIPCRESLWDLTS